MPKSNLNALYAAYQSDPTNLDALLKALRIKAMHILRRDEDLVQMFLIGFWHKLASLTDIRNLDTWTSVRLHWCLLSAVRARTRPDVLLDILSSPNLPDIESITDPIVRRAADYILQGYTQQQCADLLGLSPAALRKRLERYRCSTNK